MNKSNKSNLSEQKNRMKKILKILQKEYPDVSIQLEYTNPHELLVSTILSAQCTDARVNIVTEKLFKKYRVPEDYLKVPVEEFERDIFSCGYYKAKASYIREATKMIIENYNGKVPGKMEKLLTLPGVGRKTANVILGHSFNTPGICVDTHVMRLSNRLGFVNTHSAEKIEGILNELVPHKLWTKFTHQLINHGRRICLSRKPKCSICFLSAYCPKIGVNISF